MDSTIIIRCSFLPVPVLSRAVVIPWWWTNLQPFSCALPCVGEGETVTHDKSHDQCNRHRQDEIRLKNNGDDKGNGNRAPEEGNTEAGNHADKADGKRHKGEEPEYKDSQGSPDKEAREDVSPGKTGGKGERYEHYLYQDKEEQKDKADLKRVVDEDLGLVHCP